MYNHFRRAHKNIQRHVALDGNKFSYKEAKFKIIHAEMKGKIFYFILIDQRKQKGKCQCRQNQNTKTSIATYRYFHASFSEKYLLN
jgi:phosphopantetheinyl transferase (holo-ACP synthase)